MKKLLLILISFYFALIACNEDDFHSPTQEESYYTITNKINNFEMRININSKFYKLKTNECAQLSANQFEDLQLGVRPALVQITWLEICEAKKDNNICSIEEGAWLNICGNNNCTEAAQYEVDIEGEKNPFIRKVENKNTNICLSLNDD